MLKLIHTADWHLRDMQFGKTSRSRDFTESVFRIVDIAVQEGARYILCAGDILNTNKPSSQNIQDLIDLNKKLLDAHVELLVVTGNHDKCDPSWIKILQNQHAALGQCAMFDIDFKTYTMTGDKGEEYVVYGVPDIPPDDFRNKKDTFFPPADILMVHALVKDFAAFDAGDNALSVDDLPTNRYAGILLGDIHTHKYMRVDGKCLVGYPGSTELCSRVESPEKHVALITLDGAPGSSKADYKSIPLPLSRNIVLKDVRTVAEANALLLDVNAIKNSHPTVLVRKGPEFKDLYGRLANILDVSKAILRVTNLPKSKEVTAAAAKARRRFSTDTKQLVDFVPDFFGKDKNKDTFLVAQMLCDPAAKPSPLLEEFIDQRLNNANTITDTEKFGAP